MSPEELQQGLKDSRERLLATIAGVTEDQFKRRPPPTGEDPDPWSIAELLAHLMSQEHLRGDRIASALDSDGAAVVPSPPEAHEEGARAGRRALVPQLIHGLLASRRRIETLLKTVAEAENGFDRYVVHPVDGRQTIAWMIEARVIAHEIEHVDQIAAIRLRVGAGGVETAVAP